MAFWLPSPLAWNPVAVGRTGCLRWRYGAVKGLQTESPPTRSLKAHQLDCQFWPSGEGDGKPDCLTGRGGRVNRLGPAVWRQLPEYFRERRHQMCIHVSRIHRPNPTAWTGLGMVETLRAHGSGLLDRWRCAQLSPSPPWLATYMPNPRPGGIHSHADCNCALPGALRDRTPARTSPPTGRPNVTLVTPVSHRHSHRRDGLCT